MHIFPRRYEGPQCYTWFWLWFKLDTPLKEVVGTCFASTNSAMDAIAELAETFIVSNKCDEGEAIMLRCFAEYVRQQHQ